MEGETKTLRPLLTQAQVCEYFGIVPQTLIRWTKLGIFKPIKLVGKVFYDQGDIENSTKREKGGTN